MTEYLIAFNDKWVPDHTIEELREKSKAGAREQHPQSVVLDRSGGLVGGVVLVHECRLMLGVALLVAADPVDRAVARGRGEPAAGVGRHAGLLPLLQRGHERLARRLLCDVDVTEAADERGDQAAVLLAEDPLDGRRSALHRSVVVRRRAQARPSNGRTSTLPRHALDPSAASLSATSRSGASMTQKPPMTSLVSR